MCSSVIMANFRSGSFIHHTPSFANTESLPFPGSESNGLFWPTEKNPAFHFDLRAKCKLNSSKLIRTKKVNEPSGSSPFSKKQGHTIRKLGAVREAQEEDSTLESSKRLSSLFQTSDASNAQELTSTGLDVAEGEEDGGHVGPLLSKYVIEKLEQEEKSRPVQEPSIRRFGGQGQELPTEPTNQKNFLSLSSKPESKMLAAVDMGTNSFHMVIVRADEKGRFQIEDVEKEDVRLGSGSAGFSMITPEAEERSMAAIRRFQKIAATRKATMRVVATSAVREARNRRSFVKRIWDNTGVEVEVLSGREEACLIYLGILHALPVFKKTILTVDIGGGSTEFVIGREGQPSFATSLKLGHIRLTERFVGSDMLQKDKIEEMRRYIRVMLADSGILEVVRNMPFDLAVGSSGTIETLEQMVHPARPSQPNGQRIETETGPKASSFQEKELSKEDLAMVVKKICKAKTVDARAKLPGLPEKRADVIVGGAILLEEIFNAIGIQNMRVSPYALREGVIVDTLSRTFENFRVAPDLRNSSVMNLAVKFNVDRRLDSALHSADLAKQILAGMQTCRMGGSDCVSEAIALLDFSDFEILEAATILHYVGMFISHKGYHKHSYYLIRHTEQLLGYSPMEVEMISLLVRYHRKKIPSPKDEYFANLPELAQDKVRALCAILRIAVALDRCDTNAVKNVFVLQDFETCVLAISPATDPSTGAMKDVSLELWAARAELEYFEKVFKRKASIVIADEADVETMTVNQSLSLSS